LTVLSPVLCFTGGQRGGLPQSDFFIRTAHVRVDGGCGKEEPHAKWPRLHNYIMNVTAQRSDTSQAVLMETIHLLSHAASRSHERRGNDALRVTSRDSGLQA
jgi:hypothetical protein